MQKQKILYKAVQTEDLASLFSNESKSGIIGDMMK